MMNRVRRWLARQLIDIAIDLWPHYVDDHTYTLSENGVRYYTATFKYGGPR